MKRSHRFRRRVEVLRRDSGRESRESVDSAGDHQPGGPEWFGQDHADEPDDRPGQAHARTEFEVLGYTTDDPENLFKILGYSTQFDAFPKGLTGFQFIYSYLRLAGRDAQSAEQLAWRAIERVNLVDAAKRNIAGYSKGNAAANPAGAGVGARSESAGARRTSERTGSARPLGDDRAVSCAAAQGCYVIISSHILHEVDVISDQVILLSNGYVVAEGQIHSVRSEIQEHPTQILIRCNRPRELAAKMLEDEHTIEVSIHKDERGLLLKTRDADGSIWR